MRRRTCVAAGYCQPIQAVAAAARREAARTALRLRFRGCRLVRSSRSARPVGGDARAGRPLCGILPDERPRYTADLIRRPRRQRLRRSVSARALLTPLRLRRIRLVEVLRREKLIPQALPRYIFRLRLPSSRTIVVALLLATE